MKLLKAILSFFILFSTLSAEQKPTLLIYCGITMVKPIKEMAKIIEKTCNCNIKISQGGSKDLYEALKYSKVGDLYLPGAKVYRTNNLKDGILLDAVNIGYNQAAIFVQKGNPKNIKNLSNFTEKDLSTILCNPDSGSIGKMSKKILTKYKGEDFFYEAFDNAIQIGTDSRSLNRVLIEKKADMTINWKATAKWDENSKYIDVIKIDEKYAPRQELILSLLSFSKNKDIAKSFMDFAVSKEGQKIIKKYGFL